MPRRRRSRSSKLSKGAKAKKRSKRACSRSRIPTRYRSADDGEVAANFKELSLDVRANGAPSNQERLPEPHSPPGAPSIQRRLSVGTTGLKPLAMDFTTNDMDILHGRKLRSINSIVWSIPFSGTVDVAKLRVNVSDDLRPHIERRMKRVQEERIRLPHVSGATSTQGELLESFQLEKPYMYVLFHGDSELKFIAVSHSEGSKEKYSKHAVILAMEEIFKSGDSAQLEKALLWETDIVCAGVCMCFKFDGMRVLYLDNESGTFIPRRNNLFPVAKLFSEMANITCFAVFLPVSNLKKTPGLIPPRHPDADDGTAQTSWKEWLENIGRVDDTNTVTVYSNGVRQRFETVPNTN